ncbi:DUF3667 domain-containing protein [Aquimarina sp. U1-2]|uniref:DUF3667 domain-containing protein n=1 Tax=Aquimarina sp. U1-2 TaxID=2823141 RepID=UPI001AECF19B|nr:DUF3667 domain-containing protein [Aquimarina sp. U1-2]MBP2834070.1 DUF3667 domain-containing protein [Aquimarina sp. U1-2]
MKKKGRFLKKYRGSKCLNCGIPLDTIDVYCHNCGQVNTTKKLSFADFFNEFFASIFSYDSRLRHTIIALLFSPGKISKDYIEGKRVRYANPFRFYLSVSIIFFVITGFLSNFGNINIDNNNNAQDTTNTSPNTEYTFTATSNPNNFKAHQQELDSVNKVSNSHYKDTITRMQIKSFKEFYYSEEELKNMSFLENLIRRHFLYKNYFSDTKIKNPNRALDSLQHYKSSYHRWIYDKSVQSSDLEGNLQGIISFFWAKLPFIIFFMLPVFALAIWILYMRRDFTYMEHLVFLFHTQTMFFVLLTLGMLIDSIITKNAVDNPAIGISIIAFLIYLFLAMKRFYNQGRLKTLIKFLILNQIFTILAAIGLTLGFAVSFALY